MMDGVFPQRPRAASGCAPCGSVLRSWQGCARLPVHLGEEHRSRSPCPWRKKEREPMEQATDPIRLLIADDHPIFRFGMRMLLTAMPDMTVVGEAVTGEEAIQLTETLLPDLVLMDINIPGMNGIDATSRTCEQHRHTAILVATMLH